MTAARSSRVIVRAMTSGGADAMPGMATSDQLRALRAASGEQMDVLFLQLMLRHHEGGVIMLQYLPFADPAALAVHDAFERAAYQLADAK